MKRRGGGNHTGSHRIKRIFDCDGICWVGNAHLNLLRHQLSEFIYSNTHCFIHLFIGQDDEFRIELNKKIGRCIDDINERLPFAPLIAAIATAQDNNKNL